ncbi:TnsA-like heteromeric transposase endonuclease subunit [Nocardia sp. NBC_00881]|uniref:TnsA-like heteromeric transposase endonuclease subunit n=1 Tax=Nocardia sp. NBC_00881 TaxID=2975995 RepID=UPI003866FA5B|nr:TnsA-like heteromeric transposase endonuclease subunit [Nocardia sp. NBC_00881]
MRLSLEPVWSHTCRWTELAIAASVSDESWERLRWDTPWSVSCRVGGREVSVPVRDLGSLPMAGREPVRGFSWRQGQRHRSGLQYLVGTGRHHGYESLAEARLLLMLDFAGAVTDVLSQPLRLRYVSNEGRAEHVPDFLVATVSGWWLIDVRPAARIRSRDEVAFAATAQVAALNGWGYVVVGGWQPHAAVTVDTLSAQRRLLDDQLGIGEVLMSDAATGPVSFGELADSTSAPTVARAFLLHLLWHRRLGMDLSQPLTDRTLIVAAAAEGRKAG